MSARSGFTLLEAIVALAIVSIVCVGVLAAEGTALRAEASANAQLPLAVLAAERIAAVDIYGGSVEHLPDSLAFGTFKPPLDRAHWSTRLTRVAGTHGLWSVRVTVSADGDSLSLTTRRFRPDSVTPR